MLTCCSTKKRLKSKYNIIHINNINNNTNFNCTKSIITNIFKNQAKNQLFNLRHDLGMFAPLRKMMIAVMFGFKC